MANLDTYTAVKTGLFVRIQIDEYRTTSGGAYSEQVLRFSTYDDTKVINTESYVPLGRLLNITSSTSEIRPTGDSITVTLSGIPTDAIAEIVYSKIKGAPIEIHRGYFQINGTQIGDYEGKFFGSINNYSIQEEYDVESRTASNLIILECNNIVNTLEQKISGRKTNPQSQKTFYSTDTSMDRVPALKNSKFDFGAP
jgi:hypothetical protein